MTSKNLFFKMMRENMKQRLWSVALICLVFFFVFPVQTALSISSYLDPEQLDSALSRAQALALAQEQLIEYFIKSCSISNGALIFLMLLFAAVCGISGFSYLHSRKKTDFYHSIPISREKLFGVVSLNGFLFVAVPYLAATIISAVMIQVKTGSGACWGPAMTGYFLHMAFYFMVYATVTAAVILTGNIVVSLLGTIVFFIWGPSVVSLALAYCTSYFTTFYSNGERFDSLMQHSSPAAWYISASFADTPGQMALWALLMGALILGAALVLYRIRPSESAGRAMAFKKSQPIIKCLLVVPCALLGSLLFHEMMRKDGWTLFGLICGLVISYAVIEIIYNFDFKRLFAHKCQLLLCGIFAAAVLAFFRFDLSGYDSYLPSASRLEAAGLYTHQLDLDAAGQYQVEPELSHNSNKTYYYVKWNYKSTGEVAEAMKITDTESVLAIAEQGVRDALSRRKEVISKKRWSRYARLEDSGDIYGDVLIAYHLKNGKTVLRSYNMNKTAVSASLDRVYDSEGYKEAIYPVLAYQPEDIAGINYQEYLDFRHVPLKGEAMKAEILNTYQKELRGLTAEVRRGESPIGAIQFKTNEMQEMIDIIRKNNGNHLDFNNHLYFPIYPSFTETIRLLNECGMRVGETLTADKVEKIVLDYCGFYPASQKEQMLGEEAIQTNEMDGKNRSVTLTDKKQIRQILDSAYDNELSCKNDLQEKYNGIQITAFVPLFDQEDDMASDEIPAVEDDIYYEETESRERESVRSDEYRTYDLRFDYARVPDFVKREFRLNDEMMRHDRQRAY